MTFSLRGSLGSALLASAVLATSAVSARADYTRDDPRYYTILAWGDSAEVEHLTTSGADTAIHDAGGFTGRVGIAGDVDHVNLTDFNLTDDSSALNGSGGRLIIWQAVSQFNGGTLQNTNLNNNAIVDTQVNTAAAAARDMSTFWGAQSATLIGGGTTTLTSAFTINGGGVYKLGSVDFTDASDIITINASSSDFVVINVTGQGSGHKFKFTNGDIALTGGITADHVVWNFLGDHSSDSAYTVDFAGNPTLYGTFLAPGWDVKLAPATLYGAIWSGGDITIVSNSDLYAGSFSVTVPLPSAAWTALGLLGGVAAVATLRRRRRAPVAIA